MHDMRAHAVLLILLCEDTIAKQLVPTILMTSKASPIAT